MTTDTNNDSGFPDAAASAEDNNNNENSDRVEERAAADERTDDDDGRNFRRADKPEGEKLQKVLADSGAGSRREMEIAIAEGRVWVNGLAAKIGARVSEEDAIALDGRVVSRGEARRHRTLLYYKPAGEVVSRSENEGARTIFESLPPPGFGRWINVGRLDLDSEGLILVTTDGEWAERLAHPRNGFEREYLARVYGGLSEDDVKLARGGVEVDGKVLTPAAFEVRDKSGNGRNRWYRVVLTEGRNRAVRRLFAALGCEVSRLLRVRFGPFVLPRDLRPGEWREAPGLESFSAAAPPQAERERGWDRNRDRPREHRGGYGGHGGHGGNKGGYGKGGRDFRGGGGGGGGGGWGRDRDRDGDSHRGFRRERWDSDRPRHRDRDDRDRGGDRNHRGGGGGGFHRGGGGGGFHRGGGGGGFHRGGGGGGFHRGGGGGGGEGFRGRREFRDRDDYRSRDGGHFRDRDRDDRNHRGNGFRDRNFHDRNRNEGDDRNPGRDFRPRPRDDRDWNDRPPRKFKRDRS